MVNDINNFITNTSISHSGFDFPIIKVENGHLNNIINRVNQCVDDLNDYIMNFNVKNIGSLGVGKQYMHTINGLFVPNDGGSIVSASQMNVLFPLKKMSVKSLYASQLKVESDVDIDDTLEKALGITLIG